MSAMRGLMLFLCFPEALRRLSVSEPGQPLPIGDSLTIPKDYPKRTSKKTGKKMRQSITVIFLLFAYVWHFATKMILDLGLALWASLEAM